MLPQSQLAVCDIGPDASPAQQFLESRLAHDPSDGDSASLLHTHDTSSCYHALQEISRIRTGATGRPDNFIHRITYAGRAGYSEPYEELCWSRSQVAWSIGATLHKTFDFTGEGEDVSQVLFAYFPPPHCTTIHASRSPPSNQLHSEVGVVRAVCVFLQAHVFICLDSGDEYMLHIPFPMKKAHTLEVGILCESDFVKHSPNLCGMDGFAHLSQESEHPNSSYNMWTMVDPSTGTFRPVLAALPISLGSSDSTFCGIRLSTISTPAQHMRHEDLPVLHVANTHIEPMFPIVLTMADSGQSLQFHVMGLIDSDHADGSKSFDQSSDPLAKLSNPQHDSSGKSVTGPTSEFNVKPKKDHPFSHASIALSSTRAVAGSVVDPSILVGDEQTKGTIEGRASRRASRNMIRTSGAWLPLSAADDNHLKLEGESLASPDFNSKHQQQASVQNNMHFLQDDADLKVNLAPFLAIQEMGCVSVPFRNRGQGSSQITVCMFDRRALKIQVAVCFPDCGSVLIVQLERTNSTILIGAARSVDATMIASVVSTRYDVFDLVAYHPGQGLRIIASEHICIHLSIPLTQQVDSMECRGRGKLAVHFKGHLPRVWGWDHYTRDWLTQRCLESLDQSMCATDFAPLFSLYVQNTQRKEDLGRLEESLVRYLFRKDHIPVTSSPHLSAWEQLCQSSHDLQSDAALRTERDIFTAPPTNIDNTRHEMSRQKLQEVALTALGGLWTELGCSLARYPDFIGLGKLLQALLRYTDSSIWSDTLSRAGVPTSQHVFTARKSAFHLPPLLHPVDIFYQTLLRSKSLTAADRTKLRSGFFHSPALPNRIHELMSLLSTLLEVQPVTSPDRLSITRPFTQQLHQFKWTRETIEDLPFGFAIAMLEGLRMCQLHTPVGLPSHVYELISRPDLAKQAGCSVKSDKPCMPATIPPIHEICINPNEPHHESNKIVVDVTTKVDAQASRFSDDLRVVEVARMLNFNQEVKLTVPQTNEATTQDIHTTHAALLQMLARRRMAVPVGAAGFSFRAGSSTLALAADINLNVRTIPRHSVIQVEETKSDSLAWPRFHAGVAAGLSLCSAPELFDSSHLSSDIIQDQTGLYAGMLLGLGLNGHLKAATRVQLFRFLDAKDQQKSIAVLLGIGAASIGTGNPQLSSVISAHVPAVHPSDSNGLNVPPLTQSAGLLALGLLHLGTGNRRFSDPMLRELCSMTRVSTDPPDACRETYAWCTAMGFGMIMLGKGATGGVPVDAALLRVFGNLIHGEIAHPLPGINLSYGTIDVGVTGPAATMALALIFLKTGARDAAALCELPRTATKLEFVRPDLLLLRSLSYCLILWDEIVCSASWLGSLVPPYIREGLASGSNSLHNKHRLLETSYWNILAGSALAMGMKFAGSGNARCCSILMNVYDTLLLRCSTNSATSVSSKMQKHSLRSCGDVILLALALVMAGTGELETLLRLRNMHGTIHSSGFGTHMATHLALGMLFLGEGRYTFAITDQAIAALLCALYPIFPNASDDNRHHLQAARHLWALATEPRCLVAREVDGSREPVFLPLKLRFEKRADGETKQSSQLLAPCLLPQLQGPAWVDVHSPRYWPSSIPITDATQSQKNIPTLWLKRRAGYLGYALDPRGNESLPARGRWFENTSSDLIDFGSTSMLLGELITDDFSVMDKLSSDFSLDNSMTGLIKLINRHKGLAASTRRSQFACYSTAALMQCLMRDKLDTLPAILKCHRSVLGHDKTPFDNQQVQFLSLFYQAWTERGYSMHRLLDRNLLDKAEYIWEKCVANWAETRGSRAINSYLKSFGVWPRDLLLADQVALANWLTHTKCPDPSGLKILHSLVVEFRTNSERDVSPRSILISVLAGRQDVADAILDAWPSGE